MTDKANRPACAPEQPGTCARCDMAYDCQSKMSGRFLPWPLVALVIIVIMAFVFWFNRLAQGRSRNNNSPFSDADPSPPGGVARSVIPQRLYTLLAPCRPSAL